MRSTIRNRCIDINNSVRYAACRLLRPVRHPAIYSERLYSAIDSDIANTDNTIFDIGYHYVKRVI